MAYFTRSCTGCFESEDGHPVGEYPWDSKANCYIGSGCSECGYTGKRRFYYDEDDLELNKTPTEKADE